MQCVAVCCSVLQCIAVCCSSLQCVAVREFRAIHLLSHHSPSVGCLSHVLYDELHLICTSHVSYEWVMSGVNDSCPAPMSHVSEEWLLSIIHGACLVWTSHIWYEWVICSMSLSCLVWTSHISYVWVMCRMNEPCPARMSHTSYEQVTSRMSLSCLYMTYHSRRRTGLKNVTFSDIPQIVSVRNESWRMWISYVTYEGVMPHMNELHHLGRSHVTHKCASVSELGYGSWRTCNVL